MTTLVFVYGSLLSGFGNHRRLEAGNAKLVATGRTTERFVMHDMGAFPACVPDDAGGQILGELYEVDAATLQSLDSLEGYHPELGPGLYDRITVDVDGVPALMYVMHACKWSRGTIVSGSWRAHEATKRPPAAFACDNCDDRGYVRDGAGDEVSCWACA